MLGTAAGMGSVSALGQEIYASGEEGESFRGFRWLQNAYTSTAGSVLFMGGTTRLSSTIARRGAYSAQAVATARTVSKLIDFSEGSADFPQTMRMIDQAKNWQQWLGARLILAVNIFDTADISVSGIVRDLGLRSTPKIEVETETQEEQEEDTLRLPPTVTLDDVIVGQTLLPVTPTSGRDRRLQNLQDQYQRPEDAPNLTTYEFRGELEDLTPQQKAALDLRWAVNGNDEALPNGYEISGIYYSAPGTRGYEALKRVEEVLGYQFTGDQKNLLAQVVEQAHALESLADKKRLLLRFFPHDAAFVVLREMFAGNVGDAELRRLQRDAGSSGDVNTEKRGLFARDRRGIKDFQTISGIYNLLVRSNFNDQDLREFWMAVNKTGTVEIDEQPNMREPNRRVLI